MSFFVLPVWKEAPFLRLLIPYVAGILVQYQCKLSGTVICLGIVISPILLLLFSLKNVTSRFKRYWLSGILINFSLFFTGSILTNFKDGLNNPDSIVGHYSDNATIIARLEEPLSEKSKSFKSIASIEVLEINDSLLFPTGNIIIYLQKDSLISASRTHRSALVYGSRIVFSKKLQQIKNTGNPGGFDYKQYCAFQKIYYQVYLKPEDYKILPGKHANVFKEFLFATRSKIINIIRKHIPGDKESGLAEALLIGYKDDLDKNLVQSYSNTGVVHIIAISGLHVGLIYWLLGCLFPPITKTTLRYIKPVLIIAALWLFCFLAGGSPSVLRSAVMFTFIAIGQGISRKISIYNSLAASAFLLLCYNPFWIWDTGFQLSYAAVLSIIIFMKPIYNLLFIENKILDAVWKLNAVTTSAQILTIPICLHYFHQFPNLFLIANLVAVPLSSIILLGEILLCVANLLPFIAEKIGWLLYWLIWLMNTSIERIDRLPFAVTNNIQIPLLQIFLIYLVITSLSIWMFKGKKMACIGALAGIFFFGLGRIHSLHTIRNQQQLIIYNIPLHQAIDFIEGSRYFFKGDSILTEDDFLHRLHLTPSRIAYGISRSGSLPGLIYEPPFYMFSSKKILIIEKRIPDFSSNIKPDMDLIIISKNPELSMRDILDIFICRKIIFDASNPAWKISKWKSECDALNIPYYSVPDKGAFVMTMN